MKLIMVMLLNIIFISAVHAAPVTILFLGDSLSEGYGVDEGQAFPRLIEKALKAKNKDVAVINGGVSGATSASGLGRLKWHVKKKIDVVVLELGANDGLRGLDLAQTEKNLGGVISYAQSKKIKVLLLGLLMPPNYGAKYTADFEKMYKNLAEKYKTPLLPFFLKKVAGKSEYNLSDGIHPNAKGHELIASEILPFIEKNL